MSSRNVQWAGPVLVLLALLLCLPFWSTGPGAEEDAWGHILTLEQWHTSYSYIPSRPPGHPVYEYLTYPLHAMGGWYAVMVFSSIMMGMSSWALFLLMGKTGRAFYGGLLLLVSYPALYAGITTLDYSTSLALMLWAFVAWEKNKASLGGFVLGLASGARLTMALGGIRFLATRDFKRSFLAAVAAGAGLGLAYAWPILSSGAGFIHTYALPYPDFATLAYRVVFTGMSPLGFVAFLLLLVAAWRSKSPYLPVALAFLVLFFFYPHKGLFLLPVWALIIAMGWPQLRYSWAVSIFVITLLGPHVLGVQLDSAPTDEGFHTRIKGRSIAVSTAGSLWQEVSRRSEGRQAVEQAASLIVELPKNSMVIAGPYFAPLTYEVLQGRLTAEAKVVYYCNPTRQDSILKAGGTLYHLPGQDALNSRVYQTTQTKSVLLPGMNP